MGERAVVLGWEDASPIQEKLIKNVNSPGQC